MPQDNFEVWGIFGWVDLPVSPPLLSIYSNNFQVSPYIQLYLHQHTPSRWAKNIRHAHLVTHQLILLRI
jgi:hypothetical protein